MRRIYILRSAHPFYKECRMIRCVYSNQMKAVKTHLSKQSKALAYKVVTSLDERVSHQNA